MSRASAATDRSASASDSDDRSSVSGKRPSRAKATRASARSAALGELLWAAIVTRFGDRGCVGAQARVVGAVRWRIGHDASRRIKLSVPCSTRARQWQLAMDSMKRVKAQEVISKQTCQGRIVSRMIGPAANAWLWLSRDSLAQDALPVTTRIGQLTSASTELWHRSCARGEWVTGGLPVAPATVGHSGSRLPWWGTILRSCPSS